MILRKLPYRIQIPMGLSLAVLITALLVTIFTANISARNTRQETIETINRAVVLLQAQARPMLASDDIWRVFSLLKDTAALIPGTETKNARVAILDSAGQVFAASDPASLYIGMSLLGVAFQGQSPPVAEKLTQRTQLDLPDGGIVLIDPITSEDGQTTGFVFVEVDAKVFAPNWLALAKPVFIAVFLAVMVLAPLGWLVGKRMTRPVARIAKVIERIGQIEPASLQSDLPNTNDPELRHIGNAVKRLIQELSERSKAEERALSAERLAAVGRMTAAVAHEINNPLGGLLTATQTLRLHGDSAATRQRSVELILRGLEQIRTTVAALLPQARVEDRPLEPDDLDDVITLARAASTPNDFTLNLRASIDSALRVPSGPLRQVMLNMLLNAIKAAGHNGRIDAMLKADGSRVEFSVTNTGPSMTKEKFTEILAAESSRDPRGFGLWVCRELANHYGGQFQLASDQKVGTRLIFSVPNKERREDIA